MTGNESLVLEEGLPVHGEGGKVYAEELLGITAASSDRKAVSAVVLEDNKTLVEFAVVVHGYFLSIGDPVRDRRFCGGCDVGVGRCFWIDEGV